MRKRYRRLVIILLTAIMCIGLVPEVTSAENAETEIVESGEIEPIDDRISMESLYGTWEGGYSGTAKSGSEVDRTIKLNIDYCDEAGAFEGSAEIDNGESGIYFFSGNIDYSSGQFTFIGEDWISYAEGLYFAEFVGTVTNDMTMEGIVDQTEDLVFFMEKVSDDYNTIRIDPDSIPLNWTGENDGEDGDVVVRRNIELTIQEIDSDGTISGVITMSPSEKSAVGYGASGTYRVTGSIDFRYGKIMLHGYEWVEYPDAGENWTFDNSYLEGIMDCNNGTIEGTTSFGMWFMEVANITDVSM